MLSYRTDTTASANTDARRHARPLSPNCPCHDRLYHHSDLPSPRVPSRSRLRPNDRKGSKEDKSAMDSSLHRTQLMHANTHTTGSSELIAGQLPCSNSPNLPLHTHLPSVLARRGFMNNNKPNIGGRVFFIAEMGIFAQRSGESKEVTREVKMHEQSVCMRACDPVACERLHGCTNPVVTALQETTDRAQTRLFETHRWVPPSQSR